MPWNKKANFVDKIPSTASVVEIETNRRLDHKTLMECIENRANRLIALGVRADTHIILGNVSSFDLLLDILSVWFLGATAVPVSASCTREEVAQLTGALAPSLVFIKGSEFSLCKNDNFGSANLPQHDFTTDTTVTGAEYIPIILVTSGTTGTPKLVALSEQTLVNRLNLNVQQITASTLSRTLVLLPLHFGHGLIGNTLTALFSGGTVYLGAKKDAKSMSALGSLIDELQITFLSSVPSFWRMALRLSPSPQTQTLQRIHVGSESLSTQLWQSIAEWGGGSEVFNMYGMTETANWIAGVSGAQCDFAGGAVGKPWGGEISLRTETQGLIGSNLSAVSGEILIKSPSIMEEYIGDETATLDAFEDNWFKTGDLGEFDEAGNLRIIGRLKNQINCAGIKISMEAIDQLLEKHPDVLEACSIAIPDPVSGEVVGAAVVLKEHSNLSMEELKEWCKLQTRMEAVPVILRPTTSLPKSARGKLDRNAVQALVTKPDAH